MLLPADDATRSRQLLSMQQEVTLNEGSGSSGSVLKKIKNLSNNRDGSSDAPLTTQAIRDLEKARKEKVFSQTLIKIR